MKIQETTQKIQHIEKKIDTSNDSRTEMKHDISLYNEII